MLDNMYQNSRAIGNVGEAVAISEFIKLGFPVFIPFGQNTPVDLLVYYEGRYLKIQVKTTELIKNGKMQYELARTNGFTKKSIRYKAEEVDYFFLYCIENHYKGLVPFERIGAKRQFIIRCVEPKNNQEKRINRMEEYRFDNVIRELIEMA